MSSSANSDTTGTAQIGVTGLAVMGSNIARNFAHHGYTVDALDSTMAMLQMTRNAAAHHGVQDRIRMYFADVHALPFRADAFDVVIAFRTSGSSPNPESAQTRRLPAGDCRQQCAAEQSPGSALVSSHRTVSPGREALPAAVRIMDPEFRVSSETALSA